MAEIVLHYTPEELSILLDGMNHAIVSLGKIYHSAKLGCELPKEFEQRFKDMSFEDIENYTKLRMASIQDLYKYLLTFEEPESLFNVKAVAQ